MEKTKLSGIKRIQLIHSGRGFNRQYRSGYNRYKVLINGKPIENIFDEDELKNLSYWVNKSKRMAMTVWGTSQEFEARLAIGNFLELYRIEKKDNWGKYCQLLENTIEAIY